VVFLGSVVVVVFLLANVVVVVEVTTGTVDVVTVVLGSVVTVVLVVPCIVVVVVVVVGGRDVFTNKTTTRKKANRKITRCLLSSFLFVRYFTPLLLS